MSGVDSPAGVRLSIDHVTLAGSDLDVMRRVFAELGLATEYGGPHSNGVTHMALLGFDDGSYIELISTLELGARSPLWHPQIQDNGGPAAWAVRVDDLPREKARLTTAGIRSEGPISMTRRRPDGTDLAWELLFPGTAPPGATLPFAISDRTPRMLRVAPSPSVAGSELVGVASVVVGGWAIEETAGLYRRAYGWSEPMIAEDAGFGARLASFESTPVSIAEPVTKSGWLAGRLSRYGESPVAVLITTADLSLSARRLPLLPSQPWFGADLAWIDPERVFGWRIGLLSQRR